MAAGGTNGGTDSADINGLMWRCVVVMVGNAGKLQTEHQQADAGDQPWAMVLLGYACACLTSHPGPR